MSASQSLLVDSAMILALVLVGTIAYKLSPLLMPKADVVATPDSGCDLNRSPCGATLPEGGRVVFALTPRPVQVTTPLTAEVTLEGVTAERVAVDFAGVSMNMGFNRPQLAGKENRFAGEAMLPVCVTGRMAWQATVLVDTGRARIAAPFVFEAGH